MRKNKQTDYSSFSMHELFCVEVESQTQVMIDALLDIENDPQNEDLLEVLMRGAHSLKGAARLVNIKPVESITHEMEECFVAAQNKKIILTEANVDQLLQSVDILKSFIALGESAIHEWEINNTQLIEQTLLSLTNIKQSKISPSIVKSTTKSPVKLPAKPVKKPVNKSTATGDDNHDRVVRVSADRLGRLMGLSGELLISSKWVSPFTTDMLQLKKRQFELSQSMDLLQESILKISNIDSQTKTYLNDTISKAKECRRQLTDRLADVDHFDRRLSNQAARLNKEIISSTLRPFSDGVSGFQRMVRDIAKQSKKKVKLELQGLDREVDRDILEKIEAPLTHLIRNAIDHGLETPAERKKSGKSEVGNILVAAVYSSGMLSIIVEDDGRGVDYNNLKQAIVKKKLASKEIVTTLSEQELLEFLFLPKFSTKEKVTKLSGRGVGLDVVKEVIQEVRGLVHIQSTEGRGTRFTLQLPITLSVVPALLVEIASESYAFPLIRVNRILKVKPEQIQRMKGQQYINLNDEYLGLISGSQVFGKISETVNREEISIVLVNDHLNKYGVVVDQLIGQRELVVKSLDPRLGKVKDISATAIQEDGEPTLIIDVDDFVRSINSLITQDRVSHISEIMEVSEKVATKRVLVVDDSITVRGVEKNLLESNGYDVVLAVDGMDGWNTVRTLDFDLVITDIDMPRMDGIELVNLIKNDPNYNKLPVMIVSYKDRKEDRKRGLDAGADYYLTKGSFHDETLLDAVIDLIGEANY